MNNNIIANDRKFKAKLEITVTDSKKSRSIGFRINPPKPRAEANLLTNKITWHCYTVS
jgi:hypothetical protein